MTPSPKDVVAAVPKSGTPEKASAPPPAAQADDTRAAAPGRQAPVRRLLTAAAAALVVALLFLAYLRMSRTYPENSDESNDLLMAWDMLHGNLLLHGWYLSDVSFITTELPQYALLVWLFGLHTDTAHIAAAMTYTLVVILSVLLARGRVSRREARPRMLLTAALMFAPQLGAVFVLLLSLGHIGTAVPLLLAWLVIDRCPARWYVPVAVGLLLTWVLIADPLVLLVGVVPLVAVCAMRVARELARRQDATVQAVLRARWYELSLAVAAIAAQGVASLAGRLLQAYLHPVPYQLAPVSTWPKHAWVTVKGLLALFGAKPEGPPAAFAFALLHLAGVALVAWAVLRVARRFLSWPDMISQILLVAMVLNVAAYVPSTLASATELNAREFAVVLPFGAVLAGRTLAVGLWDSKRRWARPALLAGAVGALLAGYGASLGWAAAQPSVPAMNARLATFLSAHHLTSGIGGYWQASVVTVGSDGAVTIRAVQPGTLRPYLWEAKSSWYDASPNHANFLVTSSTPGFFNHWQPSRAALAALGAPARTYHVGPYTVYVWNKNLLAELPHQ
jgi:energy-converting hydrogenase Eha subunit E